jgi:hypothetical protein
LRFTVLGEMPSAAATSPSLATVVPAAVMEACRPGSVEGDRGHDWGDSTIKKLGELVIHPVLLSGAGS